MKLINIVRFYIGRLISVIIRFIGFLEFKNYYKKKELTFEQQEVFDYINKKKQLSFLPYSFKEKYDSSKIEIFYEDGIPYVIHNDKKLYLKKQIIKKLEKNIYNDLLIEKDPLSPHSYIDDKFFVEEGSILVDCGAAEGIFSLDNLDKCKRIFLIEPDKMWLKSLNKTFEDYKDKVTIIDKFVSDETNEYNITIDELLKEYTSEEKVFIKADIEGFESKMILGAKKSINRFNNIKISACLYHNDADLDKIENQFKNDKRFKLRVNNGYILYIYDKKKLKAPFLRKGVIKITKE